MSASGVVKVVIVGSRLVPTCYNPHLHQDFYRCVGVRPGQIPGKLRFGDVAEDEEIPEEIPVTASRAWEFGTSRKMTG